MNEPEPEVVALVSAALDQVWPRPRLEVPVEADPSHRAWRFSGRWWHRPVPTSRARPQPLPFDVPRERFEQFVADALDSLPPELGSQIDNVAVRVAEEPDIVPERGTVLGLYEGVPLTKRWGYAGSTPDRITIYRRPICALAGSEEDVREQVRRTVVHEVGHHFGIGDKRLRQLGW